MSPDSLSSSTPSFLGRAGHRLRRCDPRLVPLRPDAHELEDRRSVFPFLIPVPSGAGRHRIIVCAGPPVRSPFGGAKGDATTAAVLQDGDTHAVGIKMFSEYLLQFEIVGVFLLGAVIGAIVLAKTPKSVNLERKT